MEKDDWRGQWAVIYHYVCLHYSLPKLFPLVDKFWHGHKLKRESRKKRMLPRIIGEGPYPRKAFIQNLLGYGSGDTDNWIKRRFRFITEQKK